MSTRVVEALSRVRSPLAVFIAYALSDRLFTVVGGHEGLLVPFGPVHPATTLLGLYVLLLRLVVSFALLPWAAYLLTGHAPDAPPGAADSPR
jgi:uncharacterized membrane protein